MVLKRFGSKSVLSRKSSPGCKNSPRCKSSNTREI
jgi:hypothetical protein